MTIGFASTPFSSTTTTATSTPSTPPLRPVRTPAEDEQGGTQTRNVLDPDRAAAARRMHAAGGAEIKTGTSDFDSAEPTNGTPKRGLSGEQGEVAAGVRGIRESASALNEAISGGDQDTIRARAIEATEAVAQALEGHRPEVQQRILKSTQSELGAITRGMNELDGDGSTEAIGNLARATESLGQHGARQLTDIVAKNAPALLEGHGDNRGELTDGVKNAITNGHGALFGASLERSLRAQGQTELADEVGEETAEGMKEVREDFQEAQEKAAELDGQLAHMTERWGGVLSREEIAAGVEKFKEAHQDVYDELETQAERMGSTLEGAALGTRATNSALKEEADAAFERVPEVAATQAGSKLIADKLEQASNGKKTFVSTLNQKAEEEGGVFENQVKDAVFRSTALRLDEHVRENRLGDAHQLLRGAAMSWQSGAEARAFDQIADAVEQQQKMGGIQNAKDAIGLGKSVQGVANQLQEEGADKQTSTRFRALGATLGVAGVAANGYQFAQDPSVMNGLRTLTAGTGAASFFAKEGSIAQDALRKAGLAATVAFSVFDTGKALSTGDVGAAAQASLPAVGAGVGAAIGVWGFGVGAVPGAALGATIGTIASLGISAGNALFGSDPTEEFEQSTEPFLEGALEKAGLPTGVSERLRDANEDLEGIGRALPVVAKQMGVDPRTLFEDIARLPDDEAEEAVKVLLHVNSNASDVSEAEGQKVEDPSVEVPELTFDEAEAAHAASVLGSLYGRAPTPEALLWLRDQ